MAFRYPLQTLLRLRESLERQEENRLYAVSAEVGRLRNEIEHLREQEYAARRADLKEIAANGVAATLQFMAVCEQATNMTCAKLRAELEAAERKRVAQLLAYQAAKQKREILAGLRERQETAYQIEAAHREQQTLDDSFLLRRRLLPDE